MRTNEGAKNKNPMDRQPEHREVRRIFYYRALPLLTAATLLVVVLLPEAVGTILSSLRLYAERGPQAVWSYSTVSTAYVLSVLLGIAFCAHLAQLTCEVGQLKKALRPKLRN